MRDVDDLVARVREFEREFERIERESREARIDHYRRLVVLERRIERLEDRVELEDA